MLYFSQLGQFLISLSENNQMKLCQKMSGLCKGDLIEFGCCRRVKKINCKKVGFVGKDVDESPFTITSFRRVIQKFHLFRFQNKCFVQLKLVKKRNELHITKL